MPGFLHNDLPHLIWNIFVIISIGSNAEFYLGLIPYIALLGGSIFLGNSFTAAFRIRICTESVGADVAVCGIIAFEVIWFIFSWNKMGRSKWLYGLFLGTIIGTTVFSAFVPGNLVDEFGQIGGLIAGICITCFFYFEVIKYRIMDLGKFAFPTIYGVLVFITLITIALRNTKKCYDNVCHEGLDWQSK